VSKENSDPRDMMTRRQYLMELPFHSVDGKIGRNHGYENISVKKGVEGISKDNSVMVDSMIRIVVMVGMVNMDLRLDTNKIGFVVNTRVMLEVCLVVKRIFGVQRLEG
jgi:hypothetical protein